jgi:RES domain-containing protein
VADLPRHWRRYPPPAALRDLGTQWAAAKETAVLTVPSVVIPAETNYLLNPAHPAFGRIRIGDPEPFAFDPRMWK